MLTAVSQKPRIDQITGLFTYEYIFTVIDQILKYRENKALPFGFLLCDANNLKEINDTLGHVAGDNALSQIAKCIRVSVRNDALSFFQKFEFASFSSLPDIVARGSDRGDEFIVILPNCSFKMTQLVVEKIKGVIKANMDKTNGMDLAIGCVCSDEIELPETINDEAVKEYISNLKQLADERMYDDKREMKSLMPVEKKIKSLVAGIRRISGDLGYNLSHDDDNNEFKFLLDEAMKQFVVKSHEENKVNKVKKIN